MVLGRAVSKSFDELFDKLCNIGELKEVSCNRSAEGQKALDQNFLISKFAIYFVITGFKKLSIDKSI